MRDAVVALKAALRCDGVNVGLNLGPAAGGSQSDHLHVHCVPRWEGDTNFISVTAETRVLPDQPRRGRASASAPPGPPEPPTPTVGPHGRRTDARRGHDAELRDELPEDLDAAGYVGPYVFPNNNRRRIPGYLYLLLGGGAASRSGRSAGPGRRRCSSTAGSSARPPLLVVFGVYHLLSGCDLDVDERDALVAASREVGFAVGHASAQLGWRGLRSRPTWRILLYSAEEPPPTRGLVLVDGVDGEIVAHFTEDNPEDWSDLAAD